MDEGKSIAQEIRENPNNMDPDELEIYSRYEYVELEDLSRDELIQLGRTAAQIGCQVGLSGLTPDEWYDHGAEMPETKD